MATKPGDQHFRRGGEVVVAIAGVERAGVVQSPGAAPSSMLRAPGTTCANPGGSCPSGTPAAGRSSARSRSRTSRRSDSTGRGTPTLSLMTISAKRSATNRMGKMSSPGSACRRATSHLGPRPASPGLHPGTFKHDYGEAHDEGGRSEKTGSSSLCQSGWIFSPPLSSVTPWRIGAWWATGTPAPG